MFSLCFLAGKSQFTIGTNDTIVWTAVTSPSVGLISNGSCKNNSPDTTTFSWQILSDSAAPGWTYTGFCDKNLCYGFTTGVTHTFTLLPNASGLLELHLSTGCNPGAGNVKFLLWNAADSATSVQQGVFVVSITQSQQCLNGIIETEMAPISIYPNPVTSELTISLPQNLDNGRLDIYNLIGSKVYSQPINATKVFDLSALETGIYVARIMDNGAIVATRKFTKVQ